MKAIPGKFKHSLLVADKHKKKIRNVVRKTCTEKRKISLLKDLKIMERFEENVIEIVDGGVPNIWGHFIGGLLLARKIGIQVEADICQSPRWNWNASRMSSKYSGSNLQGEK